MGGNPGADVREVFFCCVNVEEVARGVAIGDGVRGSVVVSPVRRRMQSFSWSRTPRSWFAAALWGATKGLLWAPT